MRKFKLIRKFSTIQCFTQTLNDISISPCLSKSSGPNVILLSMAITLRDLKQLLCSLTDQYPKIIILKQNKKFCKVCT